MWLADGVVMGRDLRLSYLVIEQRKNTSLRRTDSA
jgi:hypothetical protein